MSHGKKLSLWSSVMSKKVLSYGKGTVYLSKRNYKFIHLVSAAMIHFAYRLDQKRVD